MRKMEFARLDELSFRANEAFKALRTNVEFSGDDIKVIAFTSCTSNEGKSNVTFNLARSFAENGKRVLIVDADLRKSVLAGRYKVSAVKAGLTNFLSGQSSLEEALHETNVENMYIILSGPYAPNPAELLSTEKFRKAVGDFREEYDYVLIDCPPLGSVIDAAIVAGQADGAILIIEDNAISYRFVQKVKSQLEQSDCRILGAVLNKVPMEKRGYYGKYYGRYYQGYYGKYYGE